MELFAKLSASYIFCCNNRYGMANVTTHMVELYNTSSVGNRTDVIKRNNNTL